MSQHHQGGGAQQRGGGGGSAQSSKDATQRQAQQVKVPQRLMYSFTALSRFIKERHHPASPIELIEKDWRQIIQHILDSELNLLRRVERLLFIIRHHTPYVFANNNLVKRL